MTEAERVAVQLSQTRHKTCQNHTISREAVGWDAHDRKRSLLTRETVSELPIFINAVLGRSSLCCQCTASITLSLVDLVAACVGSSNHARNRTVPQLMIDDEVSGWMLGTLDRCDDCRML